jgi:iron complex transport system ATP-binding protein
MNRAIAIKGSDIHAGYGGHPVLRGVSIELAVGEVLAIVGPNGAGKSTLLKVLGGLHRATHGSVELLGRPLESYDLRDRARKLAMSGQENPPAFSFSALEVVLMGRAPHLGALEFESPRDIDIALGALEALDVRAMASRPVLELSGGERKRVFLARAIAQEAPVMIFDEPTAYLDLKHIGEVMRLFRSIAADRNAAIIATLHDLNAAAAYSDRVMILKDGQCAGFGPPRDVLTAAALTQLYDTEVFVETNPRSGALMIAPAPRAG